METGFDELSKAYPCAAELPLTPASCVNQATCLQKWKQSDRQTLNSQYLGEILPSSHFTHSLTKPVPNHLLIFLREKRTERGVSVRKCYLLIWPICGWSLWLVPTKDESGMQVSRYFGTFRLRLRLPVEYGNAERLRHSRLRHFKG